MSGVFGMFADSSVSIAPLGYMALYALQHRGQESTGMVVSTGDELHAHKGMGLAAEVFDDAILAKLPGSQGIGHVGQTRTGKLHVTNAEPLWATSRFGPIGIAIDGSLTNRKPLRQHLLETGALLQTTTDSELILQLMVRSRKNSPEEAMVEAANELVGGYAIVTMTRDTLLGLRDPHGIRPLVLGRLDDGYILASETAAITSLGGEPIRDIAPGELIIIDRDGLHSHRIMPSQRKAFCVFEYVYLARQDSEITGQNVHLIRKEIGRVLARERPLNVDVVIPTPDSSISSALGYAEEAGIPYEMGLVKNRYVGRTFIQPTQATRQFGVRLKLHPIRTVVKDKRVVLLDDSIVRGTTTANVIRMLREAGANEVHMVVASPPFTHPCHYGIDVPTRGELIASERTIEEVRRHIDADSLHYLSLEGLQQAVQGEGRLCHACFSGEYPTPIPE